MERTGHRSRHARGAVLVMTASMRDLAPRLRSKVWHVCACTALLTRDATHTKPGGPRAIPRGSHRTHEGGRLATACSTSNARGSARDQHRRAAGGEEATASLATGVVKELNHRRHKGDRDEAIDHLRVGGLLGGRLFGGHVGALQVLLVLRLHLGALGEKLLLVRFGDKREAGALDGGARRRHVRRGEGWIRRAQRERERRRHGSAHSSVAHRPDGRARRRRPADV
mmetsp:Transcript_20314/g.64923  ORF Transcript_20314/g.64923 Transcript_20314/m.64923 type:complete len:226 (+) Transcript_20314:90-767(+)